MEGEDSKFEKHMLAAGVTSKHRVAIAVSGGPDSMALCLLAARWKGITEKPTGKYAGLIGFVVDHNLRSGSADEAMRVQQWVCNLGLNCDILKCAWADGIPSLGHLQESARNARYALLAQACQETGVEILLTAHHADDQAELFILRLSRCSGIAGLAGMASGMHLHPVFLPSALKIPIPSSLLLMRPLLKFVKEELYTICQKSGQDWVDDPTNLNLSFARNRIRKALLDPSFMTIRTEIQELIAFCRKIRRILDRDRDHLLSNVAHVSQEWGHVTIEVEKLASSGASDAVIHRALAALLQFVAQKTKPPRGRAVGSLLDRLQTKFSKGAYTVGGCNVFPAPGSKGTKAIICFSPDSPLSLSPRGIFRGHSSGRLSKESSTTFTRVPPSLSHTNLLTEKDPVLNELQSNSVVKAISVLALGMKTPTVAISEFKGLGLLSEVGASLLKDLASSVAKDMGKQPDKALEEASIAKGKSTHSEGVRKAVSIGESEYFMDRFVVSLSLRERDCGKLTSQSSALEGDTLAPSGSCCLLRQKSALWIRHFEEKDWGYLSCLARGTSDPQGITTGNFKGNVMSSDCPRQGQNRYQRISMTCGDHHGLSATEHPRPLNPIFDLHKSHLPLGPSSDVSNQTSAELHKGDLCQRTWCNVERCSKAKEAIVRLRGVPKLVRRGLPVLITAQGLVFGMPSVGYEHCPLVAMTAVFCPRTPLGGGQSSWT